MLNKPNAQCAGRRNDVEKRKIHLKHLKTFHICNLSKKKNKKKYPINRLAKLASSILTRFVVFFRQERGGERLQEVYVWKLARALVSLGKSSRPQERVSTAKESQLPVTNPHQNCPPGGAKGTVPHLEPLSEPVTRRLQEAAVGASGVA